MHNAFMHIIYIFFSFQTDDARPLCSQTASELRSLASPTSPGREGDYSGLSNGLFQAIIADPNHVLRKHFPDIKRSNYNLRPRAHEFTLPLKDDRNFIP